MATLYVRAMITGDFKVSGETIEDAASLLDGYSENDIIDALVNEDRFGVLHLEVTDAD